MPTHSKAIREDEINHAVSEAIGFLGVALYVGILSGFIYQLGVLVAAGA